jgi:hypothetical protein
MCITLSFERDKSKMKSFDINVVRSNFKEICVAIDYKKGLFSWPKGEDSELKASLFTYLIENQNYLFTKEGEFFEINDYEDIEHRTKRQKNYLGHFFLEVFKSFMEDLNFVFNKSWVIECNSTLKKIINEECAARQKEIELQKVEKKRAEIVELEKIGDEIMALKKEREEEVLRLHSLFEKQTEINRRKRFDISYITPKELFQIGLIEIDEVENICLFCERNFARNGKATVCLKDNKHRESSHFDCSQFQSYPIKVSTPAKPECSDSIAG